ITVNPVVSPGPASGAWVSQVFRDFLGREIFAGEAAFREDQLENVADRAFVASDITESPEFHTRYLQGIYQQYLGRTLDAAGQAYFIGRFQNQNATPDDVKA